MFAPEHSTTSPRLSLPQISVHLLTTSSFDPFTQCVAPSSLATGKRTGTSSSRPTITMLTAPISFAICTEKSPSGPVPNTTQSCPGRRWLCCATALYALQIGSSTAASSYLTFSGISQIACLWILRISPGILQYLANPPPHVLLSSPRFTFSSQQRKSPCSQAGQTPHTCALLSDTTLCPTFQSVTFSPTCTISPANSCPRIELNSSEPLSTLQCFISAPQIAAALISRIMSSGPHVG